MTKHDSLNTGGTGIKSLWDMYHMASEGIKGMNDVDVGNHATWEKYVQSKPDLVAWASKNNVDTSDPTAMRNGYEQYRQLIIRHILYKINNAERVFNNTPEGKSFQKANGRPLTISDLHPYTVPNLTAETGVAPWETGDESVLH